VRHFGSGPDFGTLRLSPLAVDSHTKPPPARPITGRPFVRTVVPAQKVQSTRLRPVSAGLSNAADEESGAEAFGAGCVLGSACWYTT
jgi:hypothetical protein